MISIGSLPWAQDSLASRTRTIPRFARRSRCRVQISDQPYLRRSAMAVHMLVYAEQNAVDGTGVLAKMYPT